MWLVSWIFFTKRQLKIVSSSLYSPAQGIVNPVHNEGEPVTDKPTFHENLAQRDEIKVGSERSFGLVFAVVFVIVGLLPLLNMFDQQGPIRVWALIIAALFAFLALTMPVLLKPLNKLWFRFGLLLHMIVNPLVMGLLFFVVVTPIALVMRAFGKTPLKLEFDNNANSYWIKRSPPGPLAESMKRQF